MIKSALYLILLFFLFGCETNEHPHIAFSFDDGDTKDILSYRNEDWNARIRKQLKDNHIKAVWFVVGSKMDNDAGKNLLQQWNDDGHLIANHTYNHLNYNDSSLVYPVFVSNIRKCDSLINGYSNYRKLFRFPVLKAGNTIAKRDSMRSFLQQNGYRQGWVTVDASDWYVNMRLKRRLKQDPEADISGFKDFYISHIFERAQYYNNLSLQINHRQIKHTVLLHFNLTSALFLNDLIEKFKSEGWIIDDYSEAIKDPVYAEQPTTMPSEQSLIWMQALQKGGFDLRYPGEDGEYEKEKMDKLGL